MDDRSCKDASAGGQAKSDKWEPAPYVSGAERPRGDGSVFADPQIAQMDKDGPQAFVTGWPVWHSRSPVIHGHWLKTLQCAGDYRRHGVPPEEFADFLASIRSLGFVGGNVTLPHKEAAFAAVARHDVAAEAIGAVNTLWFEKDELVGGNTDAHGFAANLDDRLAGWADGQTATVLGAGGAARGVIFALLERGYSQIFIINRTESRAEALAAHFGAKVQGKGLEAAPTCLARSDFLVNTVPASGAPDNLDLSMMDQHALVTDIVYTPLMTPTLQAAAHHGLRYTDGLGMLLHQAVPGFERWFGKTPVVDDTLRQRVLKELDDGA